MWKEEDHPLRRGEDVREERVDSSVHQVENRQDEDEEAGQLSHPGAGEEEVERDPNKAEEPEPVRKLGVPGPSQGESDPPDAADELGTDRLSNSDAQAILGQQRRHLVSGASSVLRGPSGSAVLAACAPFSS